MLLRILGIDGQLKALQYYLNELHTPGELKETRDEDLRILQKCDSVLLQIFHIFCEKHNLQYWLDYGTLLGAVRHGGFIPWDDDMDVGMPRKDYENFYIYANDELVPLGFKVKEFGIGRCIGFAYRDTETGIWLDIFPVDSFSTSLTFEEFQPVFNNCVNKYRKQYRGTETVEELSAKRENFINSNIPKGRNKIVCHGPEFRYCHNVLHTDLDIYPLAKLSFEGNEFFVPSNVDSYLRKIYGNNYNLFPKDGILHHGDPFTGISQSEIAKIRGINMEMVLSELQSKIVKL